MAITNETVESAERALNEAIDHAKRLKAKSREARQQQKRAKKAAKQAAKAARAARKASEAAPASSANPPRGAKAPTEIRTRSSPVRTAMAVLHENTEPALGDG